MVEENFNQAVSMPSGSQFAVRCKLDFVRRAAHGLGRLVWSRHPNCMSNTQSGFFRGMVRQTLRDNGTLWLNVGDSYAGSWGNYSGENRGNGSQRKIVNGSSVPNPAYDGTEKSRPVTSGKPRWY